MEITFVDQPFNDGNFEAGIVGLARIGYKRVETKDRRIWSIGRERLKAILDANKMGIIQINTYFDFVHGEDGVEKSLKLNDEMAQHAVFFKAPFIRVLTGPLGEAGIGTDRATPEIWDMAAKGLKKACRAGGGKGLSYAVETHHGTLAETTESVLRLLEMVDEPNFQVNLQIPLKGETDVYESTRRLARYVRHTHLNNFAQDGHNTYLAEGIYDIKREIAILREHGFDGALSVEHAYHHADVLDTAAREFRFLSDILKSY